MAVDLGKIVLKAFQATGKAVKGATTTVVYTNNQGEGAYDPVSGTWSGGQQNFTLTPVIRTGFSEKEVDGDRIRLKDVKLLVPAILVTFTHDISDTAALDGENWEVVKTWVDPTQTGLWIFQLRKP